MPQFNASAPEVSCPHYLPPVVGNPQVVCRGCGCLLADPRHAVNQAAGIPQTIVLTRPEAVNNPRATARRG